ncbi:MAG: hypothetical protein QXN08_01260 [Nitrososphaerales archaeon]
MAEAQISPVDLKEMLSRLYQRFIWLDEQIPKEKDTRDKIRLVDIMNKTALNILRIVEKSGLDAEEELDKVLGSVEESREAVG